MGTLKPQSNGPSYSNTVIGTLVVDGWAVTVHLVQRWGESAGCAPSMQSSHRCTKCNSSPINDLCTNFILFRAALHYNCLCTLKGWLYNVWHSVTFVFSIVPSTLNHKCHAAICSSLTSISLWAGLTEYTSHSIGPYMLIILSCLCYLFTQWQITMLIIIRAMRLRRLSKIFDYFS